jgi:hypothetical protein
MRATVMHKARDVRVENVPDAVIQHLTDAVIRSLVPVSVAAIYSHTTTCNSTVRAAVAA